MKVFTFYYNRYNNATTSIELNKNGIEHFVMIHNKEDYEKFKMNDTICGDAIITNNNKGLSYQRNSALELMEYGEWAAFMCDDFKNIVSKPIDLIISNQKNIDINFENQYIHRLRKKDSISLSQMFTIFPYLINIAEKNNIHLIGFGLHDNPLNLRNKFTTTGLADGRFWLIKKSKYKFDTNVQLIDDVAWTAENLIRHGKVLILNWLVPYFQRYTKGGFGNTTERLTQRKIECKYLVNKYYPLINYAHKTGWEYGSHIKLYGSKNNIIKSRNRNL